MNRWKNAILALPCCAAMVQASAQDRPLVVETKESLQIRSDFQQRLDVRYRLFKTRNIWTFLELDTATGRIWQVQFGVGDKSSASGRFVVNARVLAPDGKAGRFTLYETSNRWNYILLDQESGDVWQAQYTLDNEGGAGIFPLRDVQPAPVAPPPASQDAPSR
jgi:hypothetical protein